MIPFLSVRFPTTWMYSLQEKGRLGTILPLPGSWADFDQLYLGT